MRAPLALGSLRAPRGGPRRLPRTPLAAALVLVLLGVGCVTRGTYQNVVAQRNRLANERAELAQQVKLLEASNQSYSSERGTLLNQLENLREQSTKLERQVAGLQRKKKTLEQGLEQTRTQLEARSVELERLHGTYKSLVSDLESEVASGQIEIEQLRQGIRLNLSDQILFPSGSAQLSPEGKKVLRRVAEKLRKLPHRIEVQGHTDNVPIHGPLAARFPSNWELACARASRVVRLLEDAGVDPKRLTAVSYGEYHPIASNDTEKGRARNRRIEIRLLPPVSAGESAASAPEKTPKPAGTGAAVGAGANSGGGAEPDTRK